MTVVKLMKIFATTKSFAEGRKIFFGIIDGQDTARLMAAYLEFFGN